MSFFSNRTLTSIAPDPGVTFSCGACGADLERTDQVCNACGSCKVVSVSKANGAAVLVRTENNKLHPHVPTVTRPDAIGGLTP